MFKIKDKVKVVNELMPLALNSVHTVTSVKGTFIGLDGNAKSLYAAVAFELVPEVDPYAELKQAYAEGKTIELNLLSGKWYTYKNKPDWSFSIERYRIKPEPKQVKEFTRESLKGCYIINDHGELLNKFIKACNSAGYTIYSEDTLEALYVCCGGKNIMGNDHLYDHYTAQLTLKDFKAEPVKPTSYPANHFKPTHTFTGLPVYHLDDQGVFWYLNILHDRWLLSNDTLEQNKATLVPITVKEDPVPHVHAKLIKQWADNPNLIIQFKANKDWVTTIPDWSAREYRIKPTQFESELVQYDIDVLNVILAKALKGIVDLESDVTNIQSKITKLKEQL